MPFDMVDDGFLDEASLARFRTHVLPNAAVMSDQQCEQLRQFVAKGGRILATHQTSLFDGNGARRPDFGLADLFGCHVAGEPEGPLRNAYMTLRHAHPALAGLEGISRTIGPVHRQPIQGAKPEDVALTLVPSYPDLPMERVFTDRRETDIPMAICRSVGAGRVAYLPMDLDRTFAELGHGDHLALLKAMLTWVHDEPQPLVIDGPGLVDVACWQQQQSITAHLVNLNNPMTMRGSYREAVPVGPYRLRLQMPTDRKALGARLLSAGQVVPFRVDGSWIEAEVPHIDFHEVLAIDLA